MTERMLRLIESLRSRNIPMMTHEEIMRLVKGGKVVIPPVALVSKLPSDELMTGTSEAKKHVYKEDQNEQPKHDFNDLRERIRNSNPSNKPKNQPKYKPSDDDLNKK